MAISIAEAEIRIRGNTKQLDTDLKSAESKAGDAGKNISDALDRGMDFALGYTAMQGLISSIEDLGKEAIASAASLETYTVQFTVLEGSAAKAKEKVEELEDYAAHTPFRMDDVIEASRQLEVLGDKSISTGKTLAMVGNMASAVGAPYKEVARWVALLYSELKGGQPIGMSLRMMMRLGLISGDVTAKLENMTKAGASSADMWNTFTQYAGRFNGMMEAQSQTFSGLMTTMKDEAEIALRNAVTPAFQEIEKTLHSLVQFMGTKVGQEIAGALGAIALKLTAVASGVGVAYFAFKQFKHVIEIIMSAVKAVGGLEGAIATLTSPVGWIIAAAAAVYVAWKTNLGGFRDFTMSVVNQVVSWWKEYFPAIKETVLMVLKGIEIFWNDNRESILAGLHVLFLGISVVWEAIKGVIEIAMHTIQTIIGVGLLVIHGKWDEAFEYLALKAKQIFFDIEKVITTVLSKIIGAISTVVNGIAGVFHSHVAVFDNWAKGLQDVSDKSQMLGDASGNAADAVMRSTGIIQDQTEALKQNVKAKQMAAEGDPLAGLAGERMGHKGEGKGAHSGAEKMSAAAKAAAKEIEDYQRKIHDLTMELALNGDMSDRAKVKYELLHGEIGKGAQGLAQHALALMDEVKAMENENAINQRLTDSLHQQKLALAELNAGTRDKLALEEFGKRFNDISDEKHRQMIQNLADLKDQIEATNSLNAQNQQMVQGAKAMSAELQHEIDMYGVKSRAARTALELEADEYKNLSPLQRAYLVSQAKQLDNLDELAAKEKAVAEKAKEAARLQAEEFKKANESALKFSEVYKKAMEDLDHRTAIATGKVTALNDQFKQMMEKFGGGVGGALAASEYMKKLFDVQRLESFQARLKSVQKTFEDGFSKAIDRVFNTGFKGFFSSVIGGFDQMLAQMGQQWLKSQLMQGLGHLFGGFGGGGGIGGILGGAAGIPHFASGGWAKDGMPAIVGEYGPELIVPGSGGSRVYNAKQTAAMTGQQIHIHVSTPDAASFARSTTAIAAAAAQVIGHSAARNGGR